MENEDTQLHSQKTQPIAQILAFGLLFVQQKTMIREKTAKHLIGNYAKKTAANQTLETQKDNEEKILSVELKLWFIHTVCTRTIFFLD